VALTTFAVTRFVTFPGPSLDAAPPSPSRAAAARIDMLEAATRRDPENARAWQQLGAAYLRRSIASADPAYNDLADRALVRADALVPGDPGTTVLRGALLVTQHQFGRAREVVAPVAATDPFDSDALTVLVDADVELGRYDDAARDLEQLLAVKPGLPAYARVSYLRELHGDVAGAEQAMRQALAAGAGEPFDVATVTALLGDLAFGGGDLDAAARYYRDALRVSPDHLGAAVGQARVLAARGSAVMATVQLRALTARTPLPAAVALLADLQALTGSHKAAARSVEVVRSIARLQEAAGAVTDLETALFEADHGDPERALRAARAAYLTRPDNVYTADALAWALVRTGDAAAARSLIQRALRLGSADAALHYHAAVIADSLGDTAGAHAELTNAFSRNPFFSFSQRAEATALATRLGVAVPDAWSR
jgi:tetratricopeptide (TPR) repeat protein